MGCDLDDTRGPPEFREEPVVGRVLVAITQFHLRRIVIHPCDSHFGEIDIVLGKDRGDFRARPSTIVCINDIASDEVAFSQELRLDLPKHDESHED